MRKTLILATRNQGKVAELKQALSSQPAWEIQSLADFPDLPEVIETGTTFEENAVLKATTICKLTGHYCLSDDSGLEVDILDKSPGVFSARFAGEQATDEQNNIKLLDKLREVPAEKRTARFRCVLVLAKSNRPEPEVLKVTYGACEGTIANEILGNQGFGYDPLFVPEGYNQTFGELGAEVKKKNSHRSKALVPMIEFIKCL